MRPVRPPTGDIITHKAFKRIVLVLRSNHVRHTLGFTLGFIEIDAASVLLMHNLVGCVFVFVCVRVKKNAFSRAMNPIRDRAQQ